MRGRDISSLVFCVLAPVCLAQPANAQSGSLKNHAGAEAATAFESGAFRSNCDNRIIGAGPSGLQTAAEADRLLATGRYRVRQCYFDGQRAEVFDAVMAKLSAPYLRIEIKPIDLRYSASRSAGTRWSCIEGGTTIQCQRVPKLKEKSVIVPGYSAVYRYLEPVAVPSITSLRRSCAIAASDWKAIGPHLGTMIAHHGGFMSIDEYVEAQPVFARVREALSVAKARYPTDGLKGKAFSTNWQARMAEIRRIYATAPPSVSKGDKAQMMAFRLRKAFQDNKLPVPAELQHLIEIGPGEAAGSPVSIEQRVALNPQDFPLPESEWARCRYFYPTSNLFSITTPGKNY